MKRQHLMLCIALLSILILLLHSSAHAGSFTAFDPKTFIRDTGKPLTETASFSIKNPNTSYIIKVYNGGINSEYSKVSSALITLNGNVVFDTNDFNRQVSVLQKQVSLSKSNQLQVELRSATGSGLTINIEGEDATPPAISVTSPLNGYYTNNPTITVTGTASDSISWINIVTVNGTTSALTGENYSSNIPLTEGQNLIKAVAADAAGNTGNDSISVVLDTIPPKITIDPVPSLINKPQLTITGRIEDASPINSITVNGIPATLSNNTFTAIVNLIEGNNNIVIAATDKAGNTNSSSIIVNIDTTAPVINITAPLNGGTVNTSTIAVSGTVDDNSATITVNGINATVSNNTFMATNIQIVEGSNTITVTARDSIGNASTITVMITYAIPHTGPTLTIQYPQNGQVFAYPWINSRIMGSINDSAATVTMNNGRCYVFGNTFLCGQSAPLADGANIITITATSAVGTTSATATVYYKDTAPPNIDGTSIHTAITSPTINVNIYEYTGISAVKINDITAAVSKIYDYGYYVATASNVPLVAGPNTITITATDVFGNTSTATATVTYTPPDTTPPAITVSSPADGSVIATPNISINGTINDASYISTPFITITKGDMTIYQGPLLITGAPPIGFNFNSLFPLPLQEGSNTITITATDAAGNTGTATITVYRDTVPPSLTITSPADYTYVTTNTITLIGTIDDSTATVTVNGITATVSNGTFTASGIILTEGSNVITATAKDAVGNTTTKAITVYMDTNVPVITITSPSDGSYVQYSANIIGTLSECANIMVNGQSYGSYCNSFSFSPALAEGENILTITAKDYAGNTTTTSIKIIKDSIAPVISITSPTNGYFAANIITITGTIDDSTAIVKGQYYDYEQGKWIEKWTGTVVGNTFDISNVQLNEGSNTIAVKAIDKAGNETPWYSVYLDIDTIVPQITITSPNNNSYVRTKYITLTGTLSETAKININGKDYGNYAGNSFSIYNLTLAEGDNTITVTVTDDAGNSSTASVKVICDTIAPVISITSPTNGYLAANTISITGTIDDSAAIVKGQYYDYEQGKWIEKWTGTVVGNTFDISNVQLNEGSNTIAVKAIDKAGNETPWYSVYLYIDTIAPQVTITSPNNGSYVRTKYITLTGTLSETAKININGKDYGNHGGNGFSIYNFALAEGENTITVTATDYAGNSSTTAVKVICDTVTPVITITSPANYSYLNTNTITVTGAIDDNSATITVNGATATISNSIYTAEIPLNTEGSNTITVTANDAAQNTTTKTVTVYKDTITPVITITTPTDSSYSRYNNITLNGTISENAVIKINGEVYGSSNTTYTSFIKGLTLTEDENIITVTATDRAGNTATASVKVVCDTKAPVIAITTPANGSAVNTSTITVSGTIDDNTATITVNGTAAIVSGNIFTVENITLSNNSNTITVKATDQAGNTSTGTVTVIKDTTPPVIVISSPASSSTVNTASIAVTGLIDDNTAIVTVNGATAAVGNNTFTASAIQLIGEGANTINVMATDVAGNISSASLTVYLDTISPVITSTIPAVNQTYVPCDIVLTTTFSEDMDSSSITGATITLTSDTGTVSGTVTYSGNTATFTPTTRLSSNMVYTATIKGGSSGMKDLAGNPLATDYAWVFKTVTLPVMVNITEPQNGAAINKSSAIIKGTIKANTQDLGIRVNGILAELNGTNWVALVPLQIGQNTIEATATDTSGNTDKQTITINTQTTDQPIKIIANPQSGIAPLNTTFTIDTSITNPIVSYKIDFEGDGVTDLETTDAGNITHIYEIFGMYSPTVTVTDNQGNTYSETTAINVLDRTHMDALLKGKWEGMKEALINGDTTTAAAYIFDSQRSKYKEVFDSIKDQLQAIFSQTEDFVLVYVSDNRAEYENIVVEDGTAYSYPVIFVKDENGLWKIKQF